MKLKFYFHCCRLKKTQKSGGATDDDQVESQRPASPDVAATGRPLSGYMKRFLSLVEHELDAEYYDQDDKTTTDDQSPEDESYKLPASAIVAVEVTTKTETAAAEAEAQKDAAAEDDDDDEPRLRLDRTRLVPEVDIDQFVGY